MNRRNFGRRSGVIVDECVEHGLFLDPGEFEAIETFIAHGGLALASADRRKYLQDEVRKARDAAQDASARRQVAEARRSRRWSLLEWLF